MTSNPKMPCRDVGELCPTLQRGAIEFLARCKAAGLNVLITQTYRSAEYQASLYAQGRTKPGNIVTGLKGTKGNESPHQFRIAFDICKNVKGHEYDDVPFLHECGKVWRDMGGVYGGDWTGKSYDNPHMEFTNGKGYAPFRNGYVFPDNMFMPWEKVIDLTKEDDEVVQDLKVIIDGKETTAKGIVKQEIGGARNYFPATFIAQLGVSVGNQGSVPIFETVKK